MRCQVLRGHRSREAFCSQIKSTEYYVLGFVHYKCSVILIKFVLASNTVEYEVYVLVLYSV